MSEKLSFDATDRSLKDVLFGSRMFRVPRYQRPYAWDIEQVSEFWEDLASSKDNEPYFLGSFIFNTEMEAENGYVDIIDGQQRLLTITIFAAVLRDLAMGLEVEVGRLYQRQDIAVEDRSGQHSFRIRPGDTLRHYFETYIQSGGTDIRGADPATREEERVKQNYEYLHDKVSLELARFTARERQLGVLSSLRAKVSELIVIDIQITREEDAYEIFETTNARGIDLSVSDLLKNLVFKNIPAKEDRDLANEIWEEITSNIEATHTELKRFIRYFWVSRHVLVSEKKVYRQIKNKTTDWQGLLTDLWDDSIWYNRLLEGTASDFRDLKHGDKIYKAVFALRLMRVSQCHILLLSILRNYERLSTDPTHIFELIEKFTFQYSVVCRLPGNRVEKTYSKFALLIEDAVETTSAKKLSGRIQAIFSKLEKELRDAAPSEAVFKESFVEFSYRNSEQRRKVVKYILEMIDRHLSTTDEHRIDFDRVNVEHILPRNPSKEWGLSKREIHGYVNRLGNLTLLSRVINSKIQNGPIALKQPALAKSGLAVTQNLVEVLDSLDGEWGEKQIIERQEYFAHLAYNNIWTF